ncbi:MAG: hypothetical protein V1740_02075 [Candidatus Woesearchaeota archaeon]
MKITIDTKEDSHEDIRKVIRLLNHLIGESSESANGLVSNRDIFSDSSGSETPEHPTVSSAPKSSTSGNAFVNMFGSFDNNPSPAPSSSARPTASSLLNEAENSGNQEKKKRIDLSDQIQIIEY